MDRIPRALSRFNVPSDAGSRVRNPSKGIATRRHSGALLTDAYHHSVPSRIACLVAHLDPNAVLAIGSHHEGQTERA